MPGAATMRDTITVLPDILIPGGIQWIIHSTIYRGNDGRWYATGWSDLSQSRLYRTPNLSIVYDEDAGVYVPTDHYAEES